VVLSGGVFANAILAGAVVEGLRARGLRPCPHRLVPPNDGGLCLGQLAVVAARDAAGRA
jgi:hydrogenase maturation protein HypF